MASVNTPVILHPSNLPGTIKGTKKVHTYKIGSVAKLNLYYKFNFATEPSYVYKTTTSRNNETFFHILSSLCYS